MGAAKETVEIVGVMSYFIWLSNEVTKGIEKNYSELFEYLWDTPFYSSLPNDDNRGEDGRSLRYYWSTQVVNIDKDDLGLTDASCLEVLVGMAQRMADELYHSEYAKNVKECFWEIMKNLRLDYYHNGNFSLGRMAVNKIVIDWLDRKYLKNGIGGLFPLKKFAKDQREVEIWYQMMAYIDENYDI